MFNNIQTKSSTATKAQGNILAHVEQSQLTRKSNNIIQNQRWMSSLIGIGARLQVLHNIH